MKPLSPDEELNDLISSSPCCLLQFGDETCGPCHAIRSRLSQWLESHPDVTTRYISVSEYTEEAAQMGVFTVPTVRVYIEGKLAADESGYFSLDRMLDRVDRYLQMM